MFKNCSEISLELLKQRATKIHYFGLGFIQIKLGGRHRIHFYTKELPAIIGEEEVHNHRYDFESIILAGEFSQRIFSLREGDSHLLEYESCKEGVCAMQEAQPCSIQQLTSQHFTQGSSYHISHEAFHQVHSENAITSLTLEPIMKENAHIIRPKGAGKVCPFSKKVPEDELWRIVERMIETTQAL